MGNFISCTSFFAPKLKNPKSARAILPGGEIRQYRDPVKAAELMLEFPSNFLVNSKSLTIGKRFTPLTADEDLEFGNLYVMFPMRRLKSVVTASDVAVFLMAGNSAPRRIANGNNVVKVVPDDDDHVVDERPGLMSLHEMEGHDLGMMMEYKYRLAVCRSKKPSLDTISEELVFIR